MFEQFEPWIAFSPADVAGAGDAPAGATQEPSPGATEGATEPNSQPQTALGEGADTGMQPGQEGQPSDTTETAEGEPNTDAGTEHALTAPEGLPEQFNEDWSVFEADVNGWLESNPNATATEALQWAAERQAKIVAEQEALMSQRFQEAIETWENQARQDPEIGGNNYDQNVATAVKAVQTYGDDELRQYLNESGAGSHPAVIRAFYRAGKQISSPPNPQTNQGAARMSISEALYGRD